MTRSTNSYAPVTIRDAATVALLRDRPDTSPDARVLEVLLLRRHDGHVFGAGADVFPGGAVDAADGSEALVARVAGGCAEDWAWRVAALRECFEEAGLLLVEGGAAASADTTGRLRAALNAGRISWTDVLDMLDCCLDLTRLIAFDHWTTPAGAPKRYATRFFAVSAPAGQTATADGRETVTADWVAPADALADARAGKRRLMPPTRATLERLARYSDTTTAMAALANTAIKETDNARD